MTVLVFWMLVCLLFCSACVPEKSPPFAIQIVDDLTGRPVPMVQLKTLNAISFYSDNAGYIGIKAPDLLGSKIYFELHSTGYSFPRDKTGRQSTTLLIQPGQDTILRLHRLNIAERLYRVTGTGRFMHRNIIQKTRTEAPKIRAGVLGQDSNLATPYKGKIMWFWGDTFLPSSYQGNFSVSSAWTSDPRDGHWSAEEGIPLNYFTDHQGLSKSMIALDGPGYVWFDWVINIPAQNGEEQLVAKYARVNRFFGNYERGVAVFDDEKEIFQKHRAVDEWLPEFATMDHPIPVQVQDRDFLYFSGEFLFARVRPTLSSVSDPDQYEVFTSLKSGSRDSSPIIDRNASGEVQYGWKKNVPHLNFQKQKQLVSDGLMTVSESLVHTTDVLSNDEIDVARGSISWNAYRQKWILIAGKQDVWYGEADSPVGPWVYIKKVAEHRQFFYNPVHHDFLDLDGGKRIFFEGTFTTFFSKEPAIPRYEYNQLLYGLSLDEHQLVLPQPVYVTGEEDGLIYKMITDLTPLEKKHVTIPFFALDQAVDDENVMPVYQRHPGQLSLSGEVGDSPVFYAIRPSMNLNSKYEGHYEGEINFKSLDNFLSFQLLFNDGSWQIPFDGDSTKLQDLSVVDRKISVKLQHEDELYQLQGTFFQGQIMGTFENLKTGSSGSWQAGLVAQKWWLDESAGLVPFYRIEDTQGVIHFSTEPSAHAQNEIFCQVWRNPCSVHTFDFLAKPKHR